MDLPALPGAVQQAVADGTAAISTVNKVITDVKSDIADPANFTNVTLDAQQFNDLETAYNSLVKVFDDLKAVVADA